MPSVFCVMSLTASSRTTFFFFFFFFSPRLSSVSSTAECKGATKYMSVSQSFQRFFRLLEPPTFDSWHADVELCLLAGRCACSGIGAPFS